MSTPLEFDLTAHRKRANFYLVQAIGATIVAMLNASIAILATSQQGPAQVLFTALACIASIQWSAWMISTQERRTLEQVIQLMKQSSSVNS